MTCISSVCASCGPPQATTTDLYLVRSLSSLYTRLDHHWLVRIRTHLFPFTLVPVSSLDVSLMAGFQRCLYRQLSLCRARPQSPRCSFSTGLSFPAFSTCRLLQFRTPAFTSPHLKQRLPQIVLVFAKGPKQSNLNMSGRSSTALLQDYC